MTEIDTDEGKLYLATVIDLFSHHLLGYAMSAHHDAKLVVASLNMAAAIRGGDIRGVISIRTGDCSWKFRRDRRTPGTVAVHGQSVVTWITDFYNTRRLHRMCGFKSPIDYEREYRGTLAEGMAA